MLLIGFLGKCEQADHEQIADFVPTSMSPEYTTSPTPPVNDCT